MKTTKLTVAGLLICLSSLYLMNPLWAKDDILEILPVLGVYFFPVGVVVTIIGLFKKSTD